MPADSPSSALQAAAADIEQLVERTVTPAVYPHVAPLDAAVFQSAGPVAWPDALRARYTPVSPGWRWGPAWSNAWFRLRGTVPAEMAGREVFLRFSSGTEALLWQQGEPRHGLDLNHDAAPVLRVARGGGDVELFVEAACNRPLGATTFFFDDPAEVARWNEQLPGCLERCELVTIAPDAWDLKHALLFAAKLLRILPAVDQRSRTVAARLLEITAKLSGADLARTARRAADEVRSITSRTTSPRTHCLAIGHAHIDTAWLWTLRETRRKCLRTFSTALELLERHPDLRFLCTQAQQYAWVEEDSPPLFARIRERIADGRWEAGGAMWVEPDCNIPSGESLIRQILHGTRYWRERFGHRAEQAYLYLPDTFGFPASLPQIIAQAGLNTFIFNKLHWNDTNKFPHSTFLWRGIDGTEVLAHLTPGMEYNATNTPAEFRKGDENAAASPWGRACTRFAGEAQPLWLQPFGYGDGGGGPTDRMIHAAGLASSCEGMPRVEIAGARDFCERLHDQAESLRRAGAALPLWSGELYLERHRGTYTTHAAIKRSNRLAEEHLRRTEWMIFAAPSRRPDADRRFADQDLDRAWKLALLNQFHDILPGSSIGPVYEQARHQHDHVIGACSNVYGSALQLWTKPAPPSSAMAWNPSSSARTAVVDVDGRPTFIRDVPAMGAAVVETNASPDSPVIASGRALGNGVIEAALDEEGRIEQLRRTGHPEPSGTQPLNQLALYPDTPEHWEAWDIDAAYAADARPVTGPAEITMVEAGPLRAAIQVTRSIGVRSRITQHYILAAGSPRLDIRTTIDWHEERTLLRALFPTNIAANRVTCGIQFGHISRPAHRDTPFARARFEFCAHRWVDLSEPGTGLALLTESKYGHSCFGGVLGLSLLRSTRFPDPDADRGEHHFTYSLMPHDGDWRAAGVDIEAEALNRPMWVHAGHEPAWHGGGPRWAPFTMTVADTDSRVEVAALKPAEDGERLILRLVETRGDSRRTSATAVRIAWHLPIAAVESVDVAERPRRAVMLRHDSTGRTTEVWMRPFEIVSLALTRA